MKYIFCIFTFVTIFSYTTKAQSSKSIYQVAYNKIDSMLLGTNALSFKEAVFVTENSYLDNQLDNKQINIEIEALIKLLYSVSNNEQLIYSKSDRDIVLKNEAIFRIIADTIPIKINHSQIVLRTPYIYDFDDPLGEKDWTKMFVSKLLKTGKGNCHSLPYLYKILAEKIGVPAYLAFAPNHIYIKSYSEKTGWYNTELTSGTFPIDAWIMASGYVTVEAIQNGLYMDTLSTKQSVANCLVDLAQGYQHKFGKDNPDFVVKCCNTCLQYHPTNVNAMLTKAEAQKYYIQAQMKAKNVKTPQQLFANNTIKEMYEDMEQTYVRLHELGYRRMPEEMYKKWISLLKSDPKKYNKPPINIIKK